ncbi:MAG TPA: hypothetical protein VGA75_01770 [Paracoccaceae bacterium]
MRIKSLVLLAAMATALAGCLDTPAERTVGGALSGAVIADATGGSKTKGALIGAVVGGVSCGIPGLPACSSY